MPRWRQTSIFLPVPSAVVLSNAGIAIAYAAVGKVTAESGWLAPALGVAAAFPVLLTFAARHAMRGAAKPPRP